MSTQDHLVAACGALRTAWATLSLARLPGRTRRVQRHLGDAGQARLDRQAAAERADRHAVLTSGRVPSGASAAPVNVAVVDARVTISGEVDSLAWELASHLRNRKYEGLARTYRPNGATNDTLFATAVDWISLNAANSIYDHKVLNDAYNRLLAAEELARNVSGNGPDLRRLAAECPACGRRSLVWDTSSTDYREWSIACSSPKCRCDGRDCTCKLPDRQPGMTHLWLEAGWERFAEQLSQREAR